MMEVATSLAAGKGWREDVDGRLAAQISSSEALAARRSGQICEQMSKRERRMRSEIHLVQNILEFPKVVL